MPYNAAMGRDGVPPPYVIMDCSWCAETVPAAECGALFRNVEAYADERRGRFANDVYDACLNL